MTQTSAQASAGGLTSVQTAAVKSELEVVLKSVHFSGSKRCHDFLEFVVLRALEGDTESLSERFIGAKLFGRPIDYETATDAIVRVRANDVRRRLAQYYLEPHPVPEVRISLTSGSYLPEFHFLAEAKTVAIEPAPPKAPPDSHAVDGGAVAEARVESVSRRRLWLWLKWPVLIGVPVLVLAAVLAGILLMHRAVPDLAVRQFWAPILREKGTILICAGGNTYAQVPVPGFFTADKETDYPYFSLQTEVSTTLLSALIERSGSTPLFKFSASTPLPELHEHPIILLNAFNNQWTLRLVESHRFHFSPENKPDHSIVDGKQPEVRWVRDTKIPYSSADDFALLARFWDTTTDNWVVVLAGLGRNGTEAATQFAVNPHYMQLLREQVGSDFASRNIEVVLKVGVVDGKTGAPTIVAVNTW